MLGIQMDRLVEFGHGVGVALVAGIGRGQHVVFTSYRGANLLGPGPRRLRLALRRSSRRSRADETTLQFFHARLGLQ